MLEHIVLWKLKDEAEGKNKYQNATIMKDMLLNLKDKIPEIISIEVGIGIEKSDNYDVALKVVVKDKNDLQAYMNHEEHKKVGDYVLKIRTERASIDYIK